MLVRPFDWRDLPYLHALRSQTLFLDSALVLTRGPMQVVGAMLSSVLPGLGVFTAVAQHEKHPRLRLIGQAIHRSDAPVARLTFLTPQRLVRTSWFAPVLTHLARRAAAHNALRLLAELERDAAALDVFRECGFQPYGRQRIWRLPSGGLPLSSQGGRWRMARPEDAAGVQRLYRRIAPALMQQVLPQLPHLSSGLVFVRRGAVLGYVSLRYGLAGVLVQPFLQPEMSASTVENAFALLFTLPFVRGRPLYVGVRADQQWLDSLLLDMGAQPGPEQILLVKHLTVQPLRSRDTGSLSIARSAGLLAL